MSKRHEKDPSETKSGLKLKAELKRLVAAKDTKTLELLLSEYSDERREYWTLHIAPWRYDTIRLAYLDAGGDYEIAFPGAERGDQP